MDREVTFVRVYLREGDHGKRKRLTDELFQLLHEQHRVHGVTVFRGIAGFGEHGEAHAADILHLAVDLPVVIEFFDAPELAEKAIAALAERVPANHIVFWPARMLGPG